MPNRLAHETSPYLLQHADNPVDWYPWGEEALTLAKMQDKPLLLSIGYSACHWCHVMAHESFEDVDIAALMNAHFVNIKVDREERPDIDQIYQTAHNLLSRQSGGWPLTVFLTPDQEPFFTGTYFPKQPRYQLPGFGDLIVRIAAFYHERKADLAEQNQSLLRAMAQTVPAASSDIKTNTSTIHQAFTDLKASFDFEHGGFGSAPKFPNPADVEFLLRQAKLGNTEAEAMALQMLGSMAEGGIYDQIGGGFCRYSVDERWMIPHFEKMLYDNGQLLGLYANGWQIAHEKHPVLAERFARVMTETVEWLMRDMHSSEGAFYSSLDADSEGEEGKFYVWQTAEIMELLTPEESAVALRCLGFEQAPNFEGHAWYAYLAMLPSEEDIDLFNSLRAKLFAAREKRVHPGRDDKVLTSWNALAIKGLARAGRVMEKPEWIAAAQAAVDFIHQNLWLNDRLLATCKDGKAHLNAYLDDYAFLLDALLELMQAGLRPDDLDFAQTLADVLLQEFEAEDGGFYFTGHHHEALIHRPKQGYDNATPNGNGIAALALQRLGHLLGETKYLAAAERTLKAFDMVMQHNPAACPSLLMALVEYAEPPVLVILKGPEAEMHQWKLELHKQYLPNVVCLALSPALEDLPASLTRISPQAVNAWVCRGVQCLPPVDSLEGLMRSL
ncbi:MAG TPA: thioredoxin domain-containing protein [Methylophilaceae bacterium]|nr:thioredoxin domain-containing protein [Methylophilaceae bacterium]